MLVHLPHREYVKIVCEDNENRTATTVEAFQLSKRLENHRFVVDKALRMLYGSALLGIESFATDGDPNEISVVDELNGKYGMSFYRVRCRWHLIIKSFVSYCGDFSAMDGGVAHTVLDQVHNMVFNAESMTEYNTGLQELSTYLQLSEADMTPSVHRRRTRQNVKKATRARTEKGKKPAEASKACPKFAARRKAMQTFVRVVNAERKHLGHVHSAGHMTLKNTGEAGLWREAIEWETERERKMGRKRETDPSSTILASPGTNPAWPPFFFSFCVCYLFVSLLLTCIKE
jgi:hypothetical protein